MGRALPGGDAGDPLVGVEVVRRDGVVADVDRDREPAGGEHAAGLSQVGEGVHHPPASYDGHRAAELVADQDVAGVGAGRVVRMALYVGRPHPSRGQVDLEHLVGRLARHQHRPALRGDLEVADLAGKADRATYPERVGVEHQQPVGIPHGHDERVGLRVVRDPLRQRTRPSASYPPGRSSAPVRSPAPPRACRRPSRRSRSHSRRAPPVPRSRRGQGRGGAETCAQRRHPYPAVSQRTPPPLLLAWTRGTSVRARQTPHEECS